MSKHLDLEAVGFPSPYAQPLKKAKITATRLDLARSAITLQSSYPQQNGLGSILWMVQGFLTVYGLVGHDLKPSIQFRTSTQSQRRTHSEYLGDAFTHWFAQTHLGVDVLFSVERHPDLATMAPQSNTAPKTLPKGYRNPRKNTGGKSAPDLVGLGGGLAHVLEAKGRSNFSSGVSSKAKIAARNKALFQVCRVDKVDGLTPKTRTACVFSFEHNRTSGLVADPGPEQHFDLRLDRAGLLRAYYQLVLDDVFKGVSENGADGFVGVQLAPGWRLSIDRKVLELARRLDDPASANRLLATLANRRDEFRGLSRPSDDRGGVSIGPDGIKLEGPPGFELPQGSKRKG